MSSKKDDSGQRVERPVSLSPLDIKDALTGLLAVKLPAKPKRKKPVTPDEG